jgi:hypothetical protein
MLDKTKMRDGGRAGPVCDETFRQRLCLPLLMAVALMLATLVKAMSTMTRRETFRKALEPARRETT